MSRLVPALFGAALAIPFVLGISVANAQSAERAARATGQLEEVVVTAQKREESLQDVPLAVTAMTGDELNAMQVNTVDDLQFHVPGLNFGTFLGQAQVNMRGHGAEDQTIGGDPSTGYFIDGVYQGRPFLVTQSFFDTQRVEVLRGPQGTLFGRNTTGGAINIITNKPTQEFEGHGDVTIGNYSRQQLRAAVNVPFSDRLALRVAGAVDRHDGYLRNLTRDERLEDGDTRSFRGILRYLASDDITVDLKVYAYDAYGSGPIRQAPNDQSATTGGSAEPSSLRVTRQDALQNQHLEVRGSALDVEWQINEALMLKSISAYFENVADYRQDTDMSDRPLQFSRRIDDTHQYSQEFQLTSNFTGRWNFVLGLFGFYEDANVQLDPRFSLRPILSPDNEILGYTPAELDNTVITEALAAYGQVTYDFSDRARLTLGLRYSWDEKTAEGQPLVGDVTKLDDSWSQFTPRISFDYRLNDDVLTYLTVSEGWKGGSMNIVPLFSPYDPETIWSYEAGIKSQLFDRRAQLNIAVFYDKLEDQQFIRALPEETLGFVVDNAGESTVYGVELETRALLGERFSLDVSASYLNAEFDEFLTDDPGTLEPEVLDLEGKKLPRSPEFTGTLGIEYRQDLPNGGALTARGQYRYMTKVYFQQFNDLLEYGHEDAHGKTDLYLTYEAPRLDWSIQAFVKNLTDKDTIANGWRSQTAYQSLNNYAFWYAAPPRTYGLTVAYNFAGQ